MKKKWMSRTLALALAGTTVASMVPTVPVNAKESAATGTTYYVDSKDGKTVMLEQLKTRRSRHLKSE